MNFVKKAVRVFVASIALFITMVLYVICILVIVPFALLVNVDANVSEIGEKCFEKIIMAGGWHKD